MKPENQWDNDACGIELQSEMRRKPRRFVFLLLLVLGTVAVTTVFILLPASNIGMSSFGIAASVNGVGIEEQTVTDQVEAIRELQDADNGDAWYVWLVENAKTPASLRDEVLKTLVGMEVLRQYAAEQGVSASDDAIDKRRSEAISEAGSDAAWRVYLVQSRSCEQAARINIESSLIEEGLLKKLGCDASTVAQQVTQFKEQSTIRVLEEMPGGLPYDVSRSLDNGEAAAVNDEIIDQRTTSIKQELLKRQAIDPNVYAAVYVPGLTDSTVAQHPSDDTYYLKHSYVSCEDAFGVVYTERANAKDFSDPLTVIYGHKIEGTDMFFSQLHKLKDEEVFKATPAFYVVMPDKVLTYELVSIFKNDEEHLLSNYSGMDAAEKQAYCDYLSGGIENEAEENHIVENMHIDAANDKMLFLSTCIGQEEKDARLVVAGVLAEESER